MSHLKGILTRLRAWRHPREADARMDEEIRFHLEEEAEKYIRAGVEPREARRRALVAFGGVERHREALREGRRLPLVTDGWRDIRYAVRSLARTPAFSLAATLTLALGIAAPTLMFTAANAVLLRPLPVPAPDDLVRLQQLREDGSESWSVSFPEYQAYRDRSGAVLAGLAAHHLGEVTLSTGFDAEVALAMDVSGNYFDVLGLRPALGSFPRGDRVERPDVEAVVVVSHEYWRSRLSGDSAVVGRTLRVNDQLLTIVAVAPRGFHGAMLGARPAVWLPIGLVTRLQGLDPSDRGWTWLQLFGRLLPEVDRERAQAAMRVVAGGIARAGLHSVGQAPVDARVRRFSILPPRVERAVGPFMLLLLAAGTVVLLIATTNVAAMLLARGASRRREIGIRLAIGAGPGRVVRQLMTESLVLAVVAGALGVLVATWARSRVAAITPPMAAGFSLDFPVDGWVVGFAVAASIVSAVLFGLTPALRAVRYGIASGFDDGSPRVVRRSRLRGALVASQVAATLVLLVAAGLFVRTLQKALEVDHGFDPAGVLAVEINVGLNGYDEERGLVFYERLLERVRTLPGVEAAALARMIPQGRGWQTRVEVAGHDPAPGQVGFSVGFNRVSAGFFETVRMPVIAGRALRAEDASVSPTPLVVNETFARRFWPTGSPIGRGLRFGLEEALIVGVVPSSGRRGEEGRLYAYAPFGAGNFSATMWLHVRSAGSTPIQPSIVRAAMAELDPNLPPVAVTTLEEILAGELFAQRTAAEFIGGFGVAGLFLAAAGLFGLLSFSVSERTREIGVRRALGASRASVIRMVLLEAARPLATGVGIGLLAAAGTARLLRGLLHGLSPIDPLTFVGVPLLLVIAALAAASLPALRATRLDAMAALRKD